MQVLRAEQYRAMPWKNGLGVTREIGLFPTGASLDQFGWRLSMAQVDGPGPFSPFPNCDRILSVVRGGPFELVVDAEAPVRLGPDTMPFRFAADVPAEVTALDGRALDFNVMVRRDLFAADVEIHQGGATLPASDDARAVFVKTGSARLQDGTPLRYGDTLLVAGERAVIAADSDATLLVVTFFAKPNGAPMNRKVVP